MMIRILLKYKTTNPKEIPSPEILEPVWLVDPSHRTKVVTKLVYLLLHYRRLFEIVPR